MEHTEQIDQLRTVIRVHMGATPVYTHSIAELMDLIRADAPDINLTDGATFALSLCLILLSSDCEDACVHTIARSIAALSDRILMDQELAEQVG